VAVGNRLQRPESVQWNAASVDATDEPVCPQSIGESVDDWRRRWSRNRNGARDPGSSQCFPVFSALETGCGCSCALDGGAGWQVEFRH
jgi:hypothetical protein